MANNPQQKKRIRQDAKRRERNRSVRSQLKTRTRRAVEAAESGDAAAAQEALTEAQRRIDMAAAKGVLHKNTAARKLSRLSARVKALA